MLCLDTGVDQVHSMVIIELGRLCFITQTYSVTISLLIKNSVTIYRRWQHTINLLQKIVDTV